MASAFAARTHGIHNFGNRSGCVALVPYRIRSGDGDYTNHRRAIAFLGLLDPHVLAPVAFFAALIVATIVVGLKLADAELNPNKPSSGAHSH